MNDLTVATPPRPRRHRFVLTAEEDDADEAALTCPATTVKLDLNLSALANARSYYTQRKAAAVKTAKTLQAAEHAVKQAEKKAAYTINAIKVQRSIRAVRTPYWWEKFDWFLSSENLLVLLAKDTQQADMLIRRHLRSRDVYVHADVNGAPVGVVKHQGGTGEVPPLTLSQAGHAVLCRSEAWTSRATTSAWWVSADKVSKQDVTGTLLPAGLFRTLGTRNYLPPSPPVMGFGVLFRVSLGDVARHADERRVRGAAEAGDDDDAEVEVAEDDGGEEGRGVGLEAAAAGEEEDEEGEEEDDGDEEDGTVVRMLAGGGLRVTSSAPRSTPAPPIVDISDAAGGEAGGGKAGGGGAQSEAGGEVGGEAGGGEAASSAGDGEADESGKGVSEASSVAPKPHRMTAKQRRDAKKGRTGGGGGGGNGDGGGGGDGAIGGDGSSDGDGGGGGDGDDDGGDEDGSTSARQSKKAGKGADRGPGDRGPGKQPQPQPQPQQQAQGSARGKHGKLKRQKDKYGEQDEEERQLCLELLGSAGEAPLHAHVYYIVMYTDHLTTDHLTTDRPMTT